MEFSYTATRSGRLSSFLREERAMSAGLVNRLKWHEKILVNGKPEHTDYAVQTGDTITVLLDTPQIEYPAEQGEMTVLYEDDHILLMDKPAGMLIHPSRSRLTGTLANLVLGYYRRTGQRSAFHPLTRLDRDTFGVVLIAKNSHIHALLQQSPLQKTYQARIFGCLPENSGIIDAPIDRRPLPSLLRYISPTGKPSRTRCMVLEHSGGHTLVELEPLTGRTHQLRVHAAHKDGLDCPIVGDALYGTAAGRLMLHASRILFVHPGNRYNNNQS